MDSLLLGRAGLRTTGIVCYRDRRRIPALLWATGRGRGARLSGRRAPFEALQAGAVRVPELPADQPLPSPERLREVAEQYVEQALHHLERNALLEADADDGNKPSSEL